MGYKMDYIIWRSIILFFFIFQIYAENQCRSCMDQDFLQYRKYMQHEYSSRVLWLPLELTNYSCKNGNYKMSKCNVSCISVTLYDKNTFSQHSFQDCSLLIVQKHKAAEPNVDYSNFRGNYSFVDEFEDYPEIPLRIEFNLFESPEIEEESEISQFITKKWTIFVFIASFIITILLIYIILIKRKERKVQENVELQKTLDKLDLEALRSRIQNRSEQI